MRLTSSDGAFVELSPMSYQLGQSVRPADGDYDYDANWVVVGGHVHTPEGTDYSFREPCLDGGRDAGDLALAESGRPSPHNGDSAPSRPRVLTRLGQYS